MEGWRRGGKHLLQSSLILFSVPVIPGEVELALWMSLETLAEGARWTL